MGLILASRFDYRTDYRILSRERLAGFDSLYVDSGCDIAFRLANPFIDRRDALTAGTAYRCVVFGHVEGQSYRVVCRYGGQTAVAAAFSARTAQVSVPAAATGAQCELQLQAADGSYAPYAGDWSSLHDQATSDIVIAHSWFRSLSGLDYSSGFSSERILHEYEVALNTVILAEQQELMEPVRAILRDVAGIDPSSLEIINRPPTRSKPIYMKVWEARKADGLDYDPDDERQQAFLSEITKYNVTKIG